MMPEVEHHVPLGHKQKKERSFMAEAGNPNKTPIVTSREDLFANASLELLFEALENGHSQRIIAHGKSMGAHLPSGSEVLLVPATTLRLGQVIAVAGPDQRFMIHRVVGLRENGSFLLKGDANPRPDDWFPPDTSYAGVYAYRHGGSWKHPGYGPLPQISLWVRLKSKAMKVLNRS
jgi:hypothetical protein